MNSLSGMISRHSLERPEAIACSQDGRSLTYGELETASLSLEAMFRDHGVGNGHIVPILLSRSIESVVSVLALLRLGACFVPMDAESWSQARIDTVLQIVDANIVIMSHPTELKVIGFPQISNEDVAKALQVKIEVPVLVSRGEKIDSQLGSDAPLYTIFTSGTTGTPKGVVVPRRCVEHYVQQGSDDGMPFNLGLSPDDKTLLLFSLAFDGR